MRKKKSAALNDRFKIFSDRSCLRGDVEDNWSKNNFFARHNRVDDKGQFKISEIFIESEGVHFQEIAAEKFCPKFKLNELTI